MSDLAARVGRGEPRAVARLISLLENDDPQGRAALHGLHGLHARSGHAHVVGVTGSPGTGKSTLVDKLIEHYRRAGKRVGVIAVDPSSPYTGGAILGDRIRMQGRATDPGVFIRSMGTRGALGGLSHHAAEAVRVLDAAGNDVILVETVGVGQAEVDIVRLADTVLVVVVPNLGDDVQAVKAGLMEIADLFVVNKADLTGADKVAGEVEANLMLVHPDEGAWTPPILPTVAERGDGVAAVVEAIGRHRAWAEASGDWSRRRDRRLRAEVRALLTRAITDFAFDAHGEIRAPFAGLVGEAHAGRLSPEEVARSLADAFCAGGSPR